MTAETTQRNERDERDDGVDREATGRLRSDPTATTVATATATPAIPATLARLAGPRLPGLLDLLLPFAGLLLLQRLLFPAPLGIVVNGALVGGRIALIALGVALVYRANRIVNFAQGDLGGVPAMLAVMLVVSSGWSYWFGFLAGLVAAVVLGVLVETLVVRRFRQAPRLVLTVATIGLAQVLTGAALLVPRLFGDLVFADRLPQPFDARLDIEGTFFNANDIVTMAVVPLAFVALALFLRRSTVGIAVVGAAERADRAAGLGIPVQRLHTVVWAVASVLAYVAMFLRAGSVGLPIGQVLPAAFLVQALAAAVLGRFERFTSIAAAAIGLGIVDQAMVFQPDGRPADGDAVLFYVVLIGLLLVRREGRWGRALPAALAVAIGAVVTGAMIDDRLADGGHLSATDVAQALLFVAVLVGFVLLRGNGAVGGSRVDPGASTWQATHEVRPIPKELVRLPEVRAVRIGLWVALGLLVWALPEWLPNSKLNLVILVVLFGVVAASLVVLTGWAGQVSLGHMAFVGLGAAVGGALTESRGWILPVTMLSAGVVGAGAAVVVGYPALRRRGLTLAVSTLAFALFTSSYLLNGSVVGWLPVGRIDAPTLVPAIRVGDTTVLDRVVISSQAGLFYVSVAVLVLALLMVGGLRRTRTGRVLIAIRENERAVRAYGVNATRTTLAAFALSGFLAALAGSLFVHQQAELSAEPYLPQRSLELFSMVVIGGLGSLPGALLGAVYVQSADYFLPLRWQFLASGTGLLLVLMAFPAGLGSALTALRDTGLRWIARRRRLVVPSLMGERTEPPPEPAPGESPGQVDAAVSRNGVRAWSPAVPRFVARRRSGRASAAARAEVAGQCRDGRAPLLMARELEVHYGSVQVLFGVDLEVDEGEIVALLGTNGAGKSTLLRAISGQVEASGGAVVLDGSDTTHTPAHQVAARGVAQVPGGQGVFTQLSVADNLRLAAWLQRRQRHRAHERIAGVLETFPALRERLDEPAGNLSGGQQQMLTLGMAFVGRPRLLMIDELSLGLAPTIVSQLLDMVRRLREQGTTIILVEQSVNVALTVADRAYFMEKGEIRFAGPTADLLARPDLLRSVFLAGAVHEARSGPDSRGDSAPPGPAIASDRAVLEVRGVVKRFGGVLALDGVSFDVADGEVLGFVGPNGAGKTTLFDVLSGFVPADGGTIRLRSPAPADHEPHDLRAMPTHRRAWSGLGRSFQDGRLFPGLTVGEAIAVALEQHVDVRDPLAACLRLPGVGGSERRVAASVDELVELVGLGAHRDKLVREVSTGTRRIVDLACVLAQGPQVVLLDEPSSGIAQREAEALGPLLRRVRRELGASLLVIEHDLPLLLSVADRMVALDLGRVVAEGDPHQVVEHPDVVASYLGTDPSTIARSGELAPR